MEICLTVVLVVTLPVKKLNGNVEMGIAVLDLSLRKNWSPDGTQNPAWQDARNTLRKNAPVLSLRKNEPFLSLHNNAPVLPQIPPRVLLEKMHRKWRFSHHCPFCCTGKKSPILLHLEPELTLKNAFATCFAISPHFCTKNTTSSYWNLRAWIEQPHHISVSCSGT